MTLTNLSMLTLMTSLPNALKPAADEVCLSAAVRRNEIIAMFNTLSKLSQSIRTIGFMSALLEDPMSAQPSRILDT